MSIGSMLDKANSFEIMNVPVGAAIYYKAIEQVANFVTDMIDHVVPVPPLVSGSLAAWGLRLPVVQDFLGKYGSYYASMAAAGTAIDGQFHISEAVGRLLGKVESHVPSLSASPAPALPSAPAAPVSGLEGLEYLGQLPDESTPGVDADIYQEYMSQNKVGGI